MQQACLNRIQPAVVAFHVVIVLRGLAVVAQHLHGLRDGGIVRGGRARFAAGSQVFPRIKAEGRGSSHRSRLHPAVVLSRKIFGAVRLAGVLNHDQTVALRQFQNRIHVGHLPVQMDRNDGRDRASTAAADQRCPHR